MAHFPFLFIVALAVFLAYLVAYRVMGLGWLDRPNGRSAHRRAIPLGGGLGVIAGAIIPVVYVLLTGMEKGDTSRVPVLLALGLVMAALGLYDDLRNLSPRYKFALIALLCLAGAIFLYPVNAFFLDQGRLHLPAILAVAGTALWLFVMTNGANFMDGCDSLVVPGAMIGALALAVLAMTAGQAVAVVLSLALGVGLIGFAPLNRPPARLFLGDTGSLFIGFWLGAAALFYIHGGPPGAVYAVVLIFMPWLSDVLLTMAWRLFRRQELMQAHKEHFYQLLLRGGARHMQISALLLAQMLACGVLAWVFRQSATSEALALAAVATLYLIIHWQARRLWSAA